MLKLLNNLKQKFNFAVSKSRFDSNSLIAKISVKRGLPLMKILLRSLYTMGGRISPNWARACSKLVAKLYLLNKTGGKTLVVKYLKVCSVITQQVSAGYVLPDLTPLGLRISRSKSGLPRIIPKDHRIMILKGNKLVLQFWLTCFSIYRDIHFDGELKLKTIVSPSTATSTFQEFKSPSKDFAYLLWKSMKRDTFGLNSIFPITTSGPQVMSGEFNTHPNSIIRSLILFNNNESLLESLIYLANSFNVHQVLDIIHLFKISWLERVRNIKLRSVYLGQLAIKEEAAGKVRVFAMVDPLTQWVLKPLHKKLFQFLRVIPMDGTFNQLKPLNKVPFGDVPIYSFDLSAATDRLPLLIQKMIIGSLFSEELAHHWANLMVNREFKTPHRPNANIPEKVIYAVGQPMGALSSWAMLAITHHFLVQYCAWTVGICSKKQWFTEYAVLGDDIVIWNRSVAHQYQVTMASIGVEIGLAKSILSPEGIGLEFAKKTLIRGINVSAVPFKEQSSAHRKISMLTEFMKSHNMDFLATLRFLGYGYKVTPQKKNRVVQALKIAWSIPKSSEDLRTLFMVGIPFKGHRTFNLASQILKLRFHLLKLVVGHLKETKDLARKMHTNLLQYILELESNNILGSPVDSLKLQVTSPHIKKSLDTLKYVEHTCTLCLNEIEHFVFFFDGIDPSQKVRPGYRSLFKNASWLRGYLLEVESKLIRSTEFQASLNMIFELPKELDAIQCNSLINPHYSVSPSPSFLEEQRTIRMWAQWVQLFATVSRTVDSNLFDTIQSLNNLTNKN